jgi:hypothetical protein
MRPNNEGTEVKFIICYRERKQKQIVKISKITNITKVALYLSNIMNRNQG